MLVFETTAATTTTTRTTTTTTTTTTTATTTTINISTYVCPINIVCLSVCLYPRLPQSFPRDPQELYLSIYLSIHPSVHPSIYLSIYPSIYPSIYLSIYLSLSLYIYILRGRKWGLGLPSHIQLTWKRYNMQCILNHIISISYWYWYIPYWLSPIPYLLFPIPSWPAWPRQSYIYIYIHICIHKTIVAVFTDI